MYIYKYNLTRVVHVYIQILYVPLQVQPVICSTYNCTQVIESPFSNIYHVWSSSCQNELAF